MAIGNSTRRRRLSKDERQAMYRDSLNRAASGQSWSNYAAIIEGFKARGIAESNILPRENVFTFNAWKALGRFVRKGEKGVAVVSWVPTTRKERDASTGEEKTSEGKRPVTAYVFHVSQTSAVVDATATEGGAS